ncbi:MAG: hypothetical protein AAFV59_15635 [Pseudomonadota bacterium]
MIEKDAGYRIRVERALRDRFIAVCRSQDRPAAQVVREFMRQYIRDHEPANDQQENESWEKRR